jgi:hypothetical protein
MYGFRGRGVWAAPGDRSPLITLAGRVAWLVTPVFVAGLGQVAVLKTDFLPGLSVPIDGGRRWRGKPLLGARKTWRGIVVMTAVSAVTALAQATLVRGGGRLSAICPFDYRKVHPLVLGGVLGLGYCAAELPNSFVKRRLGISAGGTSRRLARLQYLVDQADSVAGCLLALRAFYRPSWAESSLVLTTGLALHIGVDQLMRTLGVKRRV